MYYVSRQSYWGVDPDDQYVVEIAHGGIDYANPDMLVAKYAGEGREYTDPREALEAAIEIASQWKKDKPNIKIGIAHGFTAGHTMPFEKDSMKDLRKWAGEAYKAMPKCVRCGEPLSKERYRITDDPDLGEFCSEYCAEVECDAIVASNHQD